MTLRLRNFPNLIEAAGGHARLAAELGRDLPSLERPSEMVRHWVERKSIPAGWWIAVRRACRRLGVRGAGLAAFAQWAEHERKRDMKDRAEKKRQRLAAKRAAA